LLGLPSTLQSFSYFSLVHVIEQVGSNGNIAGLYVGGALFKSHSLFLSLCI